jgi:hypothetical protein
MVRRLVGWLCLLFGVHESVAAQRMATPTVLAPGSEISVTLVTFGLGEEVFERFGHNALLFHDAYTLQDSAYHWGLFSFEQPGFLARFLSGNTNYWMGAVDARQLLESERRAGRLITLQRLNLTPAQAVALRDFVRWNSLDEHKYYRYDYFRDNCSTRLVDAIDRVVGSALKRQASGVRTQLSYRRESVRLTEGDAPVQAGIDIALGRPADALLTEWQSFFIPMRFRDAARTMKIPGANGEEVPLVWDEVSIPPVGVTPIAEAVESPRLAWRYSVVGCLLATIVVLLRVLTERRREAAWWLAAVGALWSLVCGLLGVILLLAWLATRHVFWAYNENVLLLTPFSLALVVLIPSALLYRKGERAARIVAGLVAAMGVFALILAIVPGGQESRAVVALLLPAQLAIAWAMSRSRTVPKTLHG